MLDRAQAGLVGCGAVALRAARTGAEVTGIDLAPALIEIARKNTAAQGLTA